MCGEMPLYACDAGGIVRSGSKVGARYKKLKASTTMKTGTTESMSQG